MREATIGSIQSPLQADLDGIAETIVDTLGVDIALLSLASNSELVSLGLSANIGRTRENRHHVPSDLLCLNVIENNEALVLPDARAHPDFRFVRYVANGTVSGYLGVPIRNAELGAIGAVCGVTSSPRNWRASDLHYLEAVALTVENLILREMYRLESADASSLASEYDQIIAAFSLVRADPTSIHDRNGRLVFANRALSDVVSDADLQSGAVMRRLRQPLTEDPLRVQVPDSHLAFLVSRTETNSGYFVCQWVPTPKTMH